MQQSCRKSERFGCRLLSFLVKPPYGAGLNCQGASVEETSVDQPTPFAQPLPRFRDSLRQSVPLLSLSDRLLLQERDSSTVLFGRSRTVPLTRALFSSALATPGRPSTHPVPTALLRRAQRFRRRARHGSVHACDLADPLAGGHALLEEPRAPREPQTGRTKAEARDERPF